MVPVLTVVASEFRSQQRNRAAARDRLAGLLREAIAPPSPPRRATIWAAVPSTAVSPASDAVPRSSASAVARRTN